ncbi:hypothetical protein SME05J_02510 [Serratia marcescens]|nr:hypothetical protein SME05J_02510 [Serratia marcescens]
MRKPIAFTQKKSKPMQAPLAKEDESFQEFEDEMHDESKNRICRYADSLDVITSVVNTIHDAVDNTINPSRAMRALAKNGSNVVITHTASAFSGLAGSTLGAVVGTLIFPGAGTAVGAAVGGLSAGIASKELTKKVLEKTPLKKNKRLQTSTFQQEIEHTHDSILRSGLFTVKNAYLSNNNSTKKNLAVMGAKKAIDEATGLSLPVGDLADFALQAKELSDGELGSKKIKKIEKIFEVIELIISMEGYDDVQDRFEYLGKEKISRDGVLNTIKREKVSSEGLSNSVVHIENRIRDTRRMLLNFQPGAS